MRIGLVALALPCTALGVWLYLEPHTFYTDFPGFGAHWVSPMGPYSQHAFSDFGGALLGLSLVVWAAARSLEHGLVRVALLAVLVWGTAHFTYHMMHLNMMSTVADVENQTALSYFIVLPAALLIDMSRTKPRRSLYTRPT